MTKQWNQKTLRLNKSYTLDVKIQYMTNIEVMGTLKVSRKQITLEISGHLEKNSNALFQQKIKTLKCTYDFSKEIYLFNLELIRGKEYALNNMKQSSFNEHYHVQELLYSSQYLSDKELFYGFTIKSKDIVKWLGHTNRQNELLSHVGKLNNKDLNEINIELKNCYMSIGYSLTRYHSQLSEGTKLTPSINILMRYGTSYTEIKKVYYAVLSLFSLLLGYNMKIDSINFRQGSNDVSYFYKQKNKKRNIHNVFISLNKDIRFHQRKQEELPIQIFQNYFELTSFENIMFLRFSEYRTYPNTEEKLLGFFRILENIMYNTEIITEKQKSILEKNNLNFKKIKIIKNSISKIKFTLFYEEISHELKEKLNFTLHDLHNIIKKRNDIVHLNDYQYSEHILKKHISYLEVLTTYALLKKIQYPEKDFIISLNFYYDKIHIMK